MSFYPLETNCFAVFYCRNCLPFSGQKSQAQLKKKKESRIIKDSSEAGGDVRQLLFHFVLRTWPISFTDSLVHFVFFPLVHFRSFTEQRPEKEWEFSFRISFSIKLPQLPGAKAVQLLCNTPPNTEAKLQRRRGDRKWKDRRERESGEWKERSRDNPHKCLALSDLVSGFPLSRYRECGWERSRVLPSPFTRLIHRRCHSVATRLHTNLLIMPGSR